MGRSRQILRGLAATQDDVNNLYVLIALPLKDVILSRFPTGEGSGVQRYEPMRKLKHFHIYIMTNGSRSHVLSTGVTGNLPQRVFEHKNKIGSKFASKYNLTRLVYYEMFSYPTDAIAREKEIKGWRRNRKLELINGMNPQWRDLAADWQNVYKPEKTAGLLAPDPSRPFGRSR